VTPLGQQTRDRLGHRQVRLASPGGANPKDQVALIDGLEVPSLRGGFGRHVPPARGARRSLEEKLLELNTGIRRDELSDGANVAPRESIPLAERVGELLEHPFGPSHVIGRPFDDHVVPAGPQPDGERRLERAQVVVEGTEQALDTFVGHRDAAQRRCGHS
jgi:hypothetical protein